MWRKCDLHRHTTPDNQPGFNFNPRDFLAECMADALDVVAVTDHDRTDHIHAVMQEAPDYGITVVPGVEISTDRGHILALSPGDNGRTVLDELCGRVPRVVGSSTVEFNRLTSALSEERPSGAGLFRNYVVLIGAHADQHGSILASQQPASTGDQVSKAQQLQALEVVDGQTLAIWRNGIKQTEVVMALLQNSDAHPTVSHQARSTWIYLPEVTTQHLRHAFATHEASISFDQQPPPVPSFWIKSIRFEGGQYDGRKIDFSPRANALIGPPSSGKSLIVDAIRWVFDSPCPIDDVESSINRRLAKCLPAGTTVFVELGGSGEEHEIQRIRGGTTAPEADTKPIVFSQAELSRRSMEPIPSVALLDIHCPQGETHKQEIERVSNKVRSDFLKIVDLAKQAKDLRLIVGNEQEGLEATRSIYLDLVGDEDTAKSLGDLGRIETWHRVADETMKEWRSAFSVPAAPQLPSAPQLQTDLPIEDYVYSEAVPSALGKYESAVSAAADELVENLQIESAARSPKVDELRSDIQVSLGGEQNATPELAGEAQRHRERLTELEQQAAQLADLDQKISVALDAIDLLLDRSAESWDGLRQARQEACTAVNKSMPSFFVRLTPDDLTTEIDELLDDLKTGTRLHEGSVLEVRNVLDRKDFVRAAIKHLQFPTAEEAEEGSNDPSVNARKIAHESMDRQKFNGIAKLAVLRPHDGIGIFRKQTGTTPVPFDGLTEGLKALAIKEISFACQGRRQYVPLRRRNVVPPG